MSTITLNPETRRYASQFKSTGSSKRRTFKRAVVNQERKANGKCKFGYK